jgi:hypothetical protein
MASIVRREKRERGPFGKLLKWAFIGFNVVMLIWIVGGLSAVSKIEVHSTAEQAGRAIGSAIGFASLLTLWAIGDIILGILVIVSRGDKIITEEAVGGLTNSTMSAEQPLGSYSKADELIAQYKTQAVDRSAATRAEAAPTFGRRH